MAEIELKMPPPGSAAGLRLPSEKALLDELLADRALREKAQQVLSRGGFEAGRRRLLASGLRVTERIIPSLVRSVTAARSILGMDREPEIYVCDDPQQNASCMSFGDGRLSILFSARLLERMGPRELLFVIGHELGHALFGHHALPSSALLQQQGAVEPKAALKLLSWSRRGEISCDRVGLLCCQDLRAAATALIKLSSGLKEPLLQFHLEDYLGQMKEIQSLSETVDDAEDWFSTHPFSPLRVVALNHFWESQPLDALIGHGKGRLASTELESRIERLLGSMEPEHVERKAPAAAAALLWGGYWVAAADGTIEDSETESIRAMSDPAAAKKAAEELSFATAPLPVIKRRFAEHAKECLKLPPAERYALIQKLIVVARADGRLDEAEKSVLREICRAFQISPGFVDQVLLMAE